MKREEAKLLVDLSKKLDYIVANLEMDDQPFMDATAECLDMFRELYVSPIFASIGEPMYDMEYVLADKDDGDYETFGTSDAPTRTVQIWLNSVKKERYKDNPSWRFYCVLKLMNTVAHEYEHQLQHCLSDKVAQNIDDPKVQQIIGEDAKKVARSVAGYYLDERKIASIMQVLMYNDALASGLEGLSKSDFEGMVAHYTFSEYVTRAHEYDARQKSKLVCERFVKDIKKLHEFKYAKDIERMFKSINQYVDEDDLEAKALVDEFLASTKDVDKASMEERMTAFCRSMQLLITEKRYIGYDYLGQDAKLAEQFAYEDALLREALWLAVKKPHNPSANEFVESKFAFIDSQEKLDDFRLKLMQLGLTDTYNLLPRSYDADGDNFKNSEYFYKQYKKMLQDGNVPLEAFVEIWNLDKQSQRDVVISQLKGMRYSHAGTALGFITSREDVQGSTKSARCSQIEHGLSLKDGKLVAENSSIMKALEDSMKGLFEEILNAPDDHFDYYNDIVSLEALLVRIAKYYGIENLDERHCEADKEFWDAPKTSFAEDLTPTQKALVTRLKLLFDQTEEFRRQVVAKKLGHPPTEDEFHYGASGRMFDSHYRTEDDDYYTLRYGPNYTAVMQIRREAMKRANQQKSKIAEQIKSAKAEHPDQPSV